MFLQQRDDHNCIFGSIFHSMVERNRRPSRRHRDLNPANPSFVLVRETPPCFSHAGSKTKEAAPESRPAAAAWSGSSAAGGSRRAADRPEPLWRPPCEAKAQVPGPSSAEPKASASQPSRGDASPPSPRTLEAIRAAMNDSSEEEEGETADRDQMDGSVSPRTRLAIQRALAEEEDTEHRTLLFSSPAGAPADIRRAVPPVVVSSSEEEGEPDGGMLPRENRDFAVKRSLLAGGSGDETGAAAVRRNEATAQKPNDRGADSEQKKQPTEETRRGSRGHTEKQQATTTEANCAAAFGRNTLSSNLSAQPGGEPLSGEAQKPPGPLKQRSDEAVEAAEERKGDDVKSEGREESESEGTVAVEGRGQLTGDARNPQTITKSVFFFSLRELHRGVGRRIERGRCRRFTCNGWTERIST